MQNRLGFGAARKVALPLVNPPNGHLMTRDIHIMARLQ